MSRVGGAGQPGEPSSGGLPSRCSSAARDRGDPLPGSAAPARRWLLVEEPGSWEERTLHTGPLRGPLGTALAAAALEARARILLIRRPERVGPQTARSWAVVDPDQGIRWGRWRSPADLFQARTALLADVHARGEQGSLFLVCTHARRDVCCAVRGRPVVDALAERWPSQTWHCSHLGGDRFAANVLVLPDGSTYGQMEPDRVVEAMESHLRGVVDADRLRGVSTQPPATQAAVVAALRRWRPAGLADVTPLSTAAIGPDAWTVELAGGGRLPQRLTATVTRRAGPQVPLTCRSGPSRAYTYAVQWAPGTPSP